VLIETNRLILREITFEDTDRFLQIFADPAGMEVNVSPFNRQMTQAWIERNLQRYAQFGFGLWALVLKENGQLIGDCGLVVQRLEGVEELELGYQVDRHWWRQGLATEAVRACCAYGFQRLERDRIVALIHLTNTASRRVVEKNGMRLVKQTFWRGHPTCVYAIERSTFIQFSCCYQENAPSHSPNA
jgi:RimJ/RimL family protein N-acetyltransferase